MVIFQHLNILVITILLIIFVLKAILCSNFLVMLSASTTHADPPPRDSAVDNIYLHSRFVDSRQPGKTGFKSL